MQIAMMFKTVVDMAERFLDPDAVPDAEPDTETSDSDAQMIAEHPGQQQLSDEIIKKMRIWLPPELKAKHADLLIIFAEDDLQYAIELQKVVNALEFATETGERIQARALLRDEAVPFVNSYVDWLEYAFEYSTLICFLFTDKFIGDPLLKELAKASFWQTVYDINKQYCFIPVYPYPQQDLPAKALSPYLRQIMPLKMYSNGWEDRVSEKIDDCLKLRLEREEDQRGRQMDYIRKLVRPIPTPERFPGLGLPAESEASMVHVLTNNNHSTSGGRRSEENLDVHSNEQLSTNADVGRLEPDGSCHTDAVAAAGFSTSSPTSSPPAAAAAKLDATSASDNIELIQMLLLVAALIAIPVFAFLHKRLSK